jgi:hypothetical protein
VTTQRSAKWRGDASKQCNRTTKMTRHSTTMQQPTKQADTERGKDVTTRGNDNATRGDDSRRRYFFYHFQGGGRLCRITFNLGIDGEGPIFVGNRHTNFVSVQLFCFCVSAQRRMLGQNWRQIDTSPTRRRQVADISS